eukprot:6147466-Pyramimonas_sp.AAC.1
MRAKIAAMSGIWLGAATAAKARAFAPWATAFGNASIRVWKSAVGARSRGRPPPGAKPWALLAARWAAAGGGSRG